MYNTFMNKPLNRKKRHIESYFTYKNQKYSFYFKTNLSKKFNINYTNLPLKNEIGLKYFGSTRYLDTNPLKSCIRVIKYYFRINKLSKYNFKIYLVPNIVLTSKPKEVRMGKGKGPVNSEKVSILKNGQIILKILNVQKKDILSINNLLEICSSKLPFRVQVVNQF